MEYLLVMTLSGSTMTCLYLLARRSLRENLYAGIYYFLAKAAVLYYLIPLPFLKDWYREILSATVWIDRRKSAQIPLTWTNYVVHADSSFHVNIYTVIQMAAAVVWVVGAGFLIVRKLIAYLRITRRFAGYAQAKMTEQEREFVAALSREYGVRRRVSLIRARDGDPTFTFGIHRPVIICARDTDSREAELLARHEMVHIRRLDVIWKILMEFATFLHWCNPFVWLLYRDFERVCECSCDEAVMRGKTKEEKKVYVRLLIDESAEQKPEEASLRWKHGFGSNAEYIRERMEYLMKNHKWNRFATGALAAALIFANSMTVFAYRDTFHETIAEGASQEEIDRTVGNDIFQFTPGESTTENWEEGNLNEIVEILYENQFVDEDGNVYEVFGDGSVSTYCNHTYVAGEAWEHHSYSGGSCEVRVYNAQRCDKCGQVIRGDLISTHTYVKCPH